VTDAEPELVREQDGPILIARLNRPAVRNALTPTLLTSLGTAVLDAENDPSIRVLVLTGTGDRAFCSGEDLRSFSGGASFAAGDPAATAAYHRLFDGEASVPIVGAANGSAVAGGLELLLGCDVVVASEDAVLGLPEIKRGLFAAGGGTTLGTRIPLATALELVLTGDSITARRGYELGLVNHVVPAEEVVTTALAIAERIASNAPLSLTASKELVRLWVTDPARASQRRDHWRAEVFASEDAKEGALAFLEKREPRWLGR